MDYVKKLIAKGISVYEQRKYYMKERQQAINIKIADVFPKYQDHYEHEVYRHVHVAVEQLAEMGIVQAQPDDRGYYETVRFCTERVEQCYQLIGRCSVPERCRELAAVIDSFAETGQDILSAFCKDQRQLLAGCQKLPYGIEYQVVKLTAILQALKAVEQLVSETYIRNFSTAVYQDSKKFATVRGAVQSILYDYSEKVVEREHILERFYLVENPTYTMFKGAAKMSGAGLSVDLSGIPGGIALPAAALDSLIEIKVDSTKVITVENLTTYHDTGAQDSLVVYLGGFHNEVRKKLLQIVYQQNSQVEYFHKGDIDVYGFLILENLRSKTGIPFQPLDMDVVTLKKYFELGYCKELTANDRKMLGSERLDEYREVLAFMAEHNCKVEQESVEAAKLRERR